MGLFLKKVKISSGKSCNFFIMQIHFSHSLDRRRN